MKHHNTSSRTFLCKTFLVLLLLSSCSIKKQYYAYESEQKDEEGRPLQYYTLEHQSGRRFKTNIIRFSDLMTTYNIFVMIEAGEDYTFFAWSVDTSSTRKPYYETRKVAMLKQTIFKNLYKVDAKKAIFRYKNNVEFKDKIFYETKDYLYKKDFNTFNLWFPPEMKRVRRIDESKFPKGSVIKWK